jgi:uncharacterized membrane protein
VVAGAAGNGSGDGRGVVEIFTEWFGPNGAGQVLARWAHYLTGAAWIGLLCYFNFVQVPAFHQLTDAVRADVLREVTARAMSWRRWSALATAATGLVILLLQDPYDGDYLEYLGTARGTAVAFGSLLGLLMLGNVWLVIVRNQSIVIDSAQQALSGRGARPDAPLAAKRLARAERCNVLFSIPMLWFMGAAPHFADGAFRFTTLPGQDYIGAAWVVFIIVVGVVELSALGQIGGYDSTTNRLLFDSAGSSILGGLIMWAILWIGAFEIVLGDA